MKILKPFLLSAFLGASMGMMSTAAISGECAEDKGRICYEPDEAIDATVNSIMAVRHAIDNGADTKELLALLRTAKNLNKEINANDLVDRKRQKAASFLKKAKKEIKNAQLQVAGEHLNKAEALFKGLHNFL